MTFDVTPFDRVDSVMSNVEAVLGIERYRQRLFFEGERMEELDRTLAEYGVPNDEELILILEQIGC
jgi:hypothetical protein